MKAIHPGWSQRQVECCLYWQGTARKQLRAEIDIFAFSITQYIIQILTRPEANGVNVTATMKTVGIELEWPPNKKAYQVALAGTKLKGKKMVNTKTAPDIRVVGTNYIIPSPDNPRIINEQAPAFLELVESIKAKGVMIPIHVRNHPKQKGKLDLLAGERRVRAAIAAGIEEIRAICYGEMGDDQAFEITFVENFAREDLTPLEQGKAVETLMVKYKNDTQAVASKMGKSIRWVLQRQALSKNLSKEWRKAIIEDVYLGVLTAAHLQLIAALPLNVQNDLLKYEFDEYALSEIPSVKQLEHQLAQRLMLLSKAPWDLSDTKLIEKTKACSKCPKRSSHQPGLWDDTTEKETVKKNDRCLDNDCWEEKLFTWLKMRFTELQAKYPTLTWVATQSYEYARKTQIRDELISELGNVLFGGWKNSKEGAKNAVPALVIDGGDIGQVRWITITEQSQQSTSSRSQRAPGTPTPLKERRVLLDKKRWSVVIRNLIEKIKKSPVDKIVNKDRILTVMALAVTFGIKDEDFSKDFSARSASDSTTWASFTRKTDRKKVLAELWASVRNTICGDLTWCGPITQTSDVLIDDAKCAAKLLGIDIKAMFKEVSEKDYPEPKSWKSLKADGTPKTAKSKKGKTTKPVRTCRVCRCTDKKACITDDGPCHWVEKDLCSACVSKTSSKKTKKAKAKKTKTKPSGMCALHK